MLVAVALFPAVEELDFAGPWEVLSAWSRLAPEDGVEVVTVADAAGPLVCAKGLTVVPERTWDEVGPVDVLVLPGGRGTRPLLEQPPFLGRLRSLAASGTLMTSVCTGSLVYAAAGLLDGRAATTHWASLDDLGRLGTGIDVRPDDRFVDTGTVVTASGVSAGIDMALHLVARLASVERARQVRRYIQYDPAPPV
jgi:transcriptional regulator GlxA family with amidase domain